MQIITFLFLITTSLAGCMLMFSNQESSGMILYNAAKTGFLDGGLGAQN